MNPQVERVHDGHKRSSYNDVWSKGVEFLRNIYRASGLSIREPSKASRIDLLKELVRSFGYDPEGVLVREAFTEPHWTVVSQAEKDEPDIRTLARTIRESPQRGGGNKRPGPAEATKLGMNVLYLRRGLMRRAQGQTGTRGINGFAEIATLIIYHVGELPFGEHRRLKARLVRRRPL